MPTRSVTADVKAVQDDVGSADPQVEEDPQEEKLLLSSQAV